MEADNKKLISLADELESIGVNPNNVLLKAIEEKRRTTHDIEYKCCGNCCNQNSCTVRKLAVKMIQECTLFHNFGDTTEIMKDLEAFIAVQCGTFGIIGDVAFE